MTETNEGGGIGKSRGGHLWRPAAMCVKITWEQQKKDAYEMRTAVCTRPPANSSRTLNSHKKQQKGIKIKSHTKSYDKKNENKQNNISTENKSTSEERAQEK